MDIHTAHTTLDYPLYVCDFDPTDAGRLIVGGGGGASRTGVGNKLTLLDTSNPDTAELASTSEVELSKDEDSVTSLAAGPRRGHTTLAYAGINGDAASAKQGKNEHFRVFGVDTPSSSSAKATAKISELARAPFFTPPAASTTTLDDTYQRIVRVSAPFPDGQGSTLPQLGACATGLSRNPQIALFDVTSAAPAAAVLPSVRGVLDLPKDVADLDVIQTGVDQYQLAYCTEYELFLFNVSTTADGMAVAAVGATESEKEDEKNGTDEPYLAYEIKKDDNGKPRPAFRSIRYVTPGFVLAVCNLPKRTGSILLGLRLPDTNTPNATGVARVNVSVKLPRTVSQATGLAVRGLAQPDAPGTRLANGSQFVAAVAGVGNDNISLSLYTLEYQTTGHRAEMLAKLYPFRTIKNVHEQPMTCVALSHFVPPAEAAAAAKTTPTTPTTPYLRLASVSVKNTVVVQYIPLRKLPATSAEAAARYVVALKSRAPSGLSFAIFCFVLFVVSSLTAQGIMEILGISQPLLGAREVVPISWLNPLPSRYAAYDRLVAVKAEAAKSDFGEFSEFTDSDSHSDFGAMPMDPVAAYFSSAREPDAQHVVFVDADTVAIAAHDEAEHGPAEPWEKLDAAQQAAWRQKLAQAGHWTEDMGETVFRGVLFGELAGVVGGLVR